MKRVGVRTVLSAGCLLLGTSFGLAQNLEALKRAALETVQAIQGANPGPLMPRWPRGRCNIKPENLYAGKPFLIRNLIQPTEGDLERLRRRVRAARRKDPNFLGDARAEVGAARANYRNYYQIPVYHRTCGYMFHVQLGDEKDGEFGWGPFKPITAARAQALLGAEKPPTFAYVHSLSFLRDGYMWVSGSRAVNAFDATKRYRIVDRAGKPVGALETRLTPLIFRESFVTTFGEASAYWHFLLPVRLEPLR